MTDWFWRKKWLFLGVILLSFISYVYFQHIFAFQFVDEEDNLILGHFLLQGQKLYSDLFSHHQPLAYILSALIQWVTTPADIYQLIFTHRFFMILWAFIWGVGLIWRFKEQIVLPLIIFELIKVFILGNLFLSESLVVYPIIYIAAVIFMQKKIIRIELFFLGFLFSFSGLLLAPIWPLLIFCAGYLIWVKKILKKDLVYVAGGCVLPVVLVSPFIDVSYYFHNVFYINYKYYIPQSAEEKMPLAFVKALFSPLIILSSPNTLGTLGFILKMMVPVYLFSMGFLIFKKRYSLFILSVVILTLANLRYYAPYSEYRSGFHLLIWIGLFTFLSGYFFQTSVLQIKNNYLRVILVVIGILLIGGVVVNSKLLFETHSFQTDFNKNYSEKVMYGEAIKVMKTPEDTLFVIPDEWLLYFQADIRNNNKMVNFYGWMSLVWELNDPVVEKFKLMPPEFFYCDCPEETVLRYSEDYHQMMRNGAKTKLWVLKSRFNQLNDEQKTKIRSLNFQLE